MAFGGVEEGFSSVQFSHSVMSDSLQTHEPQHASPSCPLPTPSLPKLMSIESVMASSHLILCQPLLLLPTIPPSIRVFSNESTLRMRWPKNWSFSFSIIPSKEIRGLISFRMDWLDLFAVQGTLKSLLQHHSLKASVLWRSRITCTLKENMLKFKIKEKSFQCPRSLGEVKTGIGEEVSLLSLRWWLCGRVS